MYLLYIRHGVCIDLDTSCKSRLSSFFSRREKLFYQGSDSNNDNSDQSFGFVWAGCERRKTGLNIRKGHPCL